MKKIALFATASMLLLASCSEEKDIYNLSQDEITAAQIKTNAEKVFGITFDPNHDWNTTTSGEVTIQADASVKKVQLLVYVCEITDPSTPSYVTRNAMKLLNQTETNGQSTIKLNYDAPQDNLGLYVAFSTDHGYFVRKVVNNSASLESTGKSRMTRGETLDTGYTLPDGDFAIANIISSYASDRGWNPGEKLYELNDEDYGKLKLTSATEADYSDEFKESFRGLVFTSFPNGREYNNLSTVKSMGYYNEGSYLITTGEPIIVTPMYKCDHPQNYGAEVYNSDLYYYYYNPAEVESPDAEYLMSLPKFKAIPFNQSFTETEDDIISKHGSFALLYYGDSKTPQVGTKGSFYFPKNYKIGFMVRAKTTHDNGKKQGEVYADGRLNNEINTNTNYYFSSSFKNETNKKDIPRAVWFTHEGRKFMCWESGTDADFNDIMMEVQGGKPIGDNIDPDPEVFTYCFEDTKVGDYDMNDVVIKAVRKDKTKVEYSLVACGAYKELYILNINVAPITDEAEVHSLFGLTPNHFINTDGSNTRDYVTVTKTVPETFSFRDPETMPQILDKSTGNIIKVSKKGESPYGIMIPDDFKYPIERICIKDAYTRFNEWGKNAVLSTDWYTEPVVSKVYNK